jgi:hypothetical protein
MQHRVMAFVAAATVTVSAAPGVRAQNVAYLVRSADADESVRFSYDTRPDVCGTGGGVGTARSDRYRYNVTTRGHRPTGDALTCESGPAFIELRRAGDRILREGLVVGRTPTGSPADWPRVGPAEAAAFLLSDAALASAAPTAARDMIFAATVADTETWPRLLELARDRFIASEARRAVVFWLGQAAGDRVVAGLTSLAGDRAEEVAVRESAVFALSQMKDDSATDALMSIARNHSEPRIRRAALFWLAQTGSPRAIAFFEEILRGGS